MRNWLSRLTSFAVILTAALGANAAPPARVEILYELARNGTTLAEVQHALQHDGKTYELTETWRGRGLLALRGTAVRRSRGLVSPNGLRPLHFSDERTGRNTARVTFDWQEKTATMQYKGDPRVEPLPPRAHDRLAFVFNFAFGPPPNGDIEFHILDGRGQSRHVYTVVGHERLKTPVGEFDTVKISRKSDDHRTEIWFATERSYLPVRVLVLQDDGTRYDQVVVKMTAQ